MKFYFLYTSWGLRKPELESAQFLDHQTKAARPDKQKIAEAFHATQVNGPGQALTFERMLPVKRKPFSEVHLETECMNSAHITNRSYLSDHDKELLREAKDDFPQYQMQTPILGFQNSENGDEGMKAAGSCTVGFSASSVQVPYFLNRKRSRQVHVGRLC